MQLPVHIDVEDAEAVTLGNGLTVTVMVPCAELQPTPSLPVNEYVVVTVGFAVVVAHVGQLKPVVGVHE